MWAYYNGFVSPTYLDLTASSELFLMVTLGGPATLVGPVLGAGAIVLLKNVMSAYTARWLLDPRHRLHRDDPVGAEGIWNLGRKAEAGRSFVIVECRLQASDRSSFAGVPRARRNCPPARPDTGGPIKIGFMVPLSGGSRRTAATS